MASAWIDTLRKAQKTCLLQDGKKKVHYTLSEGVQLVEEFDTRTGDLLVRKWCKKGSLGGEGTWEFEVGEELQLRKLETAGMMESLTNPICVRKDTKKVFQWRIRNLPYPLDVYDVKVHEEENVIMIRTSNKKYYKKFGIPDVDRAKLKLQQCMVSVAHANNTLIVSYEKPKEILVMEKLIQEEMNKVKVMQEGEVSDCKPS